MTWFRRAHDAVAPQPQPDPDAPDALLRRLWEQIQFVNRSAGQLPAEALVVARRITDTVREVIDTSADREIDAHAVSSINGIVGDYLPTTLKAYLALDPSARDATLRSGRTPREALAEQLDALWSAATELLAATRAHDVDALLSQGSFLRTKFTRSDLDL